MAAAMKAKRERELASWLQKRGKAAPDSRAHPADRLSTSGRSSPASGRTTPRSDTSTQDRSPRSPRAAKALSSTAVSGRQQSLDSRQLPYSLSGEDTIAAYPTRLKTPARQNSAPPAVSTQTDGLQPAGCAAPLDPTSIKHSIRMSTLQQTDRAYREPPAYVIGTPVVPQPAHAGPISPTAGANHSEQTGRHSYDPARQSGQHQAAHAQGSQADLQTDEQARNRSDPAQEQRASEGALPSDMPLHPGQADPVSGHNEQQLQQQSYHVQFQPQQQLSNDGPQAAALYAPQDDRPMSTTHIEAPRTTEHAAPSQPQPGQAVSQPAGLVRKEGLIIHTPSEVSSLRSVAGVSGLSAHSSREEAPPASHVPSEVLSPRPAAGVSGPSAHSSQPEAHPANDNQSGTGDDGLAGRSTPQPHQPGLHLAAVMIRPAVLFGGDSNINVDGAQAETSGLQAVSRSGSDSSPSPETATTSMHYPAQNSTSAASTAVAASLPDPQHAFALGEQAVTSAAYGIDSSRYAHANQLGSQAHRSVTGPDPARTSGHSGELAIAVLTSPSHTPTAPSAAASAWAHQSADHATVAVPDAASPQALQHPGAPMHASAPDTAPPLAQPGSASSSAMPPQAATSAAAAAMASSQQQHQPSAAHTSGSPRPAASAAPNQQPAVWLPSPSATPVLASAHQHLLSLSSPHPQHSPTAAALSAGSHLPSTSGQPASHLSLPSPPATMAAAAPSAPAQPSASPLPSPSGQTATASSVPSPTAAAAAAARQPGTLHVVVTSTRPSDATDSPGGTPRSAQHSTSTPRAAQHRVITPQAAQHSVFTPRAAPGMVRLTEYARELYESDHFNQQCVQALELDLSQIFQGLPATPHRACQQLKDAALLLSHCLAQAVLKKEALVQHSVRYETELQRQSQLLIDEVISMEQQRDEALRELSRAQFARTHAEAQLQVQGAQLDALLVSLKKLQARKADSSHFDSSAWLSLLSR